ncbi:hypothetical protein [Variovorax paradoxus]|uniref:hypothetical protein n=1 Tax=Variovorax paradoxus TaxID=34073 RepID=UPI003D64AD13
MQPQVSRRQDTRLGRTIASLAVFAIVVFGSNSSAAADLCSQASPSAGAEASITHGFDFIVEPAGVSSSFTGCQYAWIGDGSVPAEMRKVFTTYYVNGKARRHESHWPHKPMILCMYESDGLSSDKYVNPAACPPTEDEVPR